MPVIIEVRGEGCEGRRWLVVIIAWAMMLISLVSPAGTEPFIFIDHTPTGVLVLVSFLGVFTNGMIGDIAFDLLLVALLVFLLSPFLVARRPSSAHGGLAWWSASLILLLASLLPLAWHDAEGVGTLMWGFYLYAASHTLMFLACLMAPSDTPPASRKRGFPVVVPNESAGQSQSS